MIAGVMLSSREKKRLCVLDEGVSQPIISENMSPEGAEDRGASVDGIGKLDIAPVTLWACVRLGICDHGECVVADAEVEVRLLSG